MFKRRTVSLVLFAALLAGGAAYIANQWAVNRNSISIAAAEESPVIVAILDIPYGSKVEEKHIRLISMPTELVPAGVYTDPEEIIGMVANDDALKGDVLRSARFAEHLEGTTLASLIEKNKRAITVRVDDVVGVGGFLLPGNRVDILATKRENQKYSTETVVKDLKVLAVDQTASTNENDPVIVRAVTLEVDPAQAETIVKARNEGTIQLSLRNPNEEDVIVVEAPKPAPKPIVRSYNSNRITVIRGTDVTVVNR